MQVMSCERVIQIHTLHRIAAFMSCVNLLDIVCVTYIYIAIIYTLSIKCL